METSNESNQKSGNDKTKDTTQDNTKGSSGSANLAPKNESYEYFSDADPWRTSRIDSTRGETDTLLSNVQRKSAGFRDANPKQLRNIHSDAIERQGWSEARQDGFIAILRLGRRTPPRS